MHWAAGGQHAVHTCGADTDTLLSAAHSKSVEFAAVEEFSEDVWDLFFNDPWAVVLDGDAEASWLSLVDADPDFREDAGFFASVQGVVDRFFYGGKESFSGVIEPQ